MPPDGEAQREAWRLLGNVVFRWLNRFAAAACFGWSAGLLTVCVWIHWWAESSLLTAFLCYLPPFVALVPNAGLLPLAAISRRRLVLMPLLAVSAGLFLWLYAGYEFGTGTPVSAESTPDTLKVLTCNWGQNHKTSLKPFLLTTNPDVIVMQDVGRRIPLFENDPFFGAWPHVVHEGEHFLMSRYPVTLHHSIFSTGTVPSEKGKQQLGAGFVLEWNGGQVKIYSIHLPTPRDVLSWYATRGTFLYGLLGLPGTPWAARRQEYEAYWQCRVGYAQTIAAEASTFSGPKILAGDLNTPPHGQGYHALRSVFIHDAHQDAGIGFGCTFPGDARNPAGLFRPWLRLDVAMADSRWNIVGCTTESGRKTQHLAVCGAFQLKILTIR